MTTTGHNCGNKTNVSPTAQRENLYSSCTGHNNLYAPSLRGITPFALFIAGSSLGNKVPQFEERQAGSAFVQFVVRVYNFNTFPSQFNANPHFLSKPSEHKRFKKIRLIL